MTKNIIAAAALGITAIGFSSCGKGGSFQTTKEGLEYKIIKGDGKSDKKAQIGDIVEVHIHAYVGDSLIFDSRDVKFDPGNGRKGAPISIPVQELHYKFQPEAGLTMLSPGDSGIFRIAIDSFKRRGEKMPPWMKAQDKIEYRVKLFSIKTKEQVQQEQMQKAAGQNATDDSLLQDYFKKNNLAPTKSPSGVYYTIDKPGTGENIKSGQEASVMYTGKTMDGVTFDSNVDPKFGHADALKVKVGQGMVIRGWDEGLQMLNKGSKAKLFIPSSLAYGPQGSQSIPPNSVLIFEVEIKDVK